MCPNVLLYYIHVVTYHFEPTQLFRHVSRCWGSAVQLHTTSHGKNGERCGRSNRSSRKSLNWEWESCRQPMRTNRESWRPWERSVTFSNNSWPSTPTVFHLNKCLYQVVSLPCLNIIHLSAMLWHFVFSQHQKVRTSKTTNIHRLT